MSFLHAQRMRSASTVITLKIPVLQMSDKIASICPDQSLPEQKLFTLESHLLEEEHR